MLSCAFLSFRICLRKIQKNKEGFVCCFFSPSCLRQFFFYFLFIIIIIFGSVVHMAQRLNVWMSETGEWWKAVLASGSHHLQEKWRKCPQLSLFLCSYPVATSLLSESYKGPEAGRAPDLWENNGSAISLCSVEARWVTLLTEVSLHREF